MARQRSKVMPYRSQPRRTRGGSFGVPEWREGGRLALSEPRRRRKLSWWRQVSPIMVTLPLATFVAVFTWDGLPPAQGVDLGSAATTSKDQESARLSMCSGPVRSNCVVDGDTFWYAGEKIRVADINTPEVSQPECRREARLGEAATDRLRTLLNEGPFTLEPTDRDRDRYGRLLRVVTREGESLGAALVREGLAEEWQGSRSSWC